MKIGLINFNRKGICEGNVPPVPPIGLEYLTDDLREDKHEVTLLDLCFVDSDNRMDILGAFVNDKDIIGITFRNLGVENYWMTDDDQFFVPNLKELIASVKKIKEIPVVVGGEAFSIYPKKILSSVDADFGISGPGETAFRLLVNNLGRYKKGTILKGPANLNILHKRDLIDYDRYIVEGGAPAIQLKNGCPFRCSFCVEAENPLQIRVIDPVIEELKILLSKNVKFLFVADAEFNNSIQQAISFCDRILEEKLEFEWTTYLNPVPMTEELVRKLKLSGLRNPCISVNSGDDFMLDQFNSGFNLDDVRKMTEWFHKYDFDFTVDIILGGPNETLESAKKTIKFMEEINPTVVGMNIGVRLYASTGLGKRIINNELETDGKIYGNTDSNDNLFLPIFYISDIRIRDFLKEVCDSDPKYCLLGYNDFGGINYKVAKNEE